MISFPFEYVQADTIDEAVGVFQEFQSQGKRALYFSGGTEIITMGRVNTLAFDAVIDIKNIPECSLQQIENGQILLGAGLNLKTVSTENLYPMLSHAVARIADHTAQCKITLGGNVAGTIIYHEAALPLLLADAAVLLVGPQGSHTVKLLELYNPALQLRPGEFIVQFSFDASYAEMPYVHAKHTEGEKIGYPLVTICGIRTNQSIRAAASGILPYPCMLGQAALEDVIRLKNTLHPVADQILNAVREPLMTDTLSSGTFRQKVLRDSVLNMLERLAEDL